MTSVENADLTKLREIGWAEWDPIGLRASDCPRDEYDPYLLRAVTMFRGGSSIADVAAYLDSVASEHMRLGQPSSLPSDASLRTASAIRDSVVLIRMSDEQSR